MFTLTRWAEELALFVLPVWVWLVGPLVLLLLVLLVWLGGKLLFHKRVSELEVAVIFDKRSQAFSRFLGPGRHWLKPWEQRKATISTSVTKVRRRRCEEVHTYDGILFSIEWTLTYHLDPLKIEPERQRSAARWLPDKSSVEDFLRDQVDHGLRLVVGGKSSTDLYRPLMQLELEKELKDEVYEVVKSVGIELQGIMLGAIRGPEKLENAFEEALKHQVEVKGETKALQQLDEDLVRKVRSEAEIRHLQEFERIYTLGEHGVALPYRPDVPSEKGENGERS
jgi:regulator of protease activity HflC (stomatin/prohibitin superfamily)